MGSSLLPDAKWVLSAAGARKVFFPRLEIYRDETHLHHDRSEYCLYSCVTHSGWGNLQMEVPYLWQSFPFVVSNIFIAVNYSDVSVTKV